MLYRVESDGAVKVLVDGVHDALDAHRIRVDVQEGCFRGVTVPACPDGEMFFAWQGSALTLGTDLFQIARQTGRHTAVPEGRARFARHGVSAAGETPAEGIGRLQTDMRYDHTLAPLKSARDSPSWAERGFAGFRDAFLSDLAATVATSHGPVAVLLSGGVDSTLIALALKYLDVDFRAYTVHYSPAMRESDQDKVRAQATAARFGWKHRAIELDWTAVDGSDLEMGVRMMPTAAHLFLPFERLAAAAAADGCDVMLSGQNIDNLYNLGATSRIGLNRAGITSLVRRWFHSEPYVRAVLRNSDGSILDPIYRAGGRLAAGLYSRLRQEPYRAPQTGMDLVAGFNRSTDYLPFSQMSCEVPADPEGTTAADVRAALVLGRVHEYFVGGASQAVFAAARVHGLRGALPFSTDAIVEGFEHLELGWKDIASPKRFVYRLARELNGGRTPTTAVRARNRLPHYHQWVDVFLSKSPLAHAIVESYDEDLWLPSTPAQGLNQALSCFWWDEVTRLLEESAR